MSAESFFNNRKVQVVFGIITIISIIAFLMKIFGKSQVEESAARSRHKQYLKVRPSYADYIYKDFADVLDSALLRYVTEDEDAVYGIFRDTKNISDVNKLIEAFGTRRQMFSTYQVTLPQAIAIMFNAGEKKKLNGILTGKGINYVFK